MRRTRLRRRPRRLRTDSIGGTRPLGGLALGVVVALAAALTWFIAPFAGSPSTARAATVLRGDRVEVPGGTTIDDDLYVAATRAIIEGRVTGDLLAATVFANVVGPVDGGVTVVSGRAEVRGPVGDDVRALGASVAIYGQVAGDVVVLGGSVTLVEEAVVTGSVVLLGGALTIVRDATVGGDVRGAAVDVDIEGRVRGDVSLTARRLFVAPGAHIDGALRYRSGSEAVIGAGAVVRGPIERRDLAESLPLGTVLLWRHAAVLRLLAMLAAGAGLLWLAPHRFVVVADAARSAPIESWCVGTGLLICLPIVLGIAALSVIGLPLAFVGAGSVASALYLSQAVVGLALGRLLLRLPTGHSPRWPNFAAMTVGVLCVAALRLAPLTGVGLLVSVGTAVYGLGAIVLGVTGSGFGREAIHGLSQDRNVASGSPPPTGADPDAERRRATNPARHAGSRLVQGVVRFLSGYLLGFCLVVAAVAAVGSAAAVLVRLTLSLGTSISVAMTIGVRPFVAAALAATLVVVGAWTLAVLIYRRR